MRWKRMLVAAAVVILVLIGAICAMVSFYDYNRFKPMIAREVKDATGRELTIGGDIDVRFGVIPTLVVENISFQNAPWGSRTQLATVKRMELKVALLPLIRGEFEFMHLVLTEPDVILEINPAGKSNFEFETPEEGETTLPVLIFNDVRIKKGLFNYRDGQTDKTYTVGLDRLKAVVPGLDKSLDLALEGVFEGYPFALEGTIGPIAAWIEPGHPLPVDLTAEARGASLGVKGEIRDPVNLKDLSFNLSAEGLSVTDVAKLAGITDMPELGAFKLEAKVADPNGKPALEELDCRVGSEDLAELRLNGTVEDLLAMRGISVDFTVRGKDFANLTRFGMPPPPVQGAFSATGRIFDPEPHVFSVSDLNIVLGNYEIGGQMNLYPVRQPPFLTANLHSENFDLGPFNLVARLTGSTDRLSLEKLNLKMGSESLAELSLTGAVKDLLELQGVDLNFQVRGKDLANFKKFTGQPLPVHGPFSASGQVIMPVEKNLRVPDLRIACGKNNIDGSLDLDLKGPQPLLRAVLSSRKFNLQSLLIPEIANQSWARASTDLGSFRLAVQLAGFAEQLAVEKLDLRTGTDNLAVLRLDGSIKNLPAQRGIDLNFAVRGKNAANLGKFIGQSLPVEGVYAISGQVNDPAAKNYKVSNLKIVLGQNKLAGWLDLNLAGQQPQLAAVLKTQKFNLKPLSMPGPSALYKIRDIPDFGPLALAVKLVGPAVEKLDLDLGSPELLEVKLQGGIKDLAALQGFDLEFAVRSQDLANLQKLRGPAVPFQGGLNASGRFVDLATEIYKISSLKIALGDNDGSGSVVLNLSKKRPHVTADLSSRKLDLRPIWAMADKTGAAQDQPAKPDEKRGKVFSKDPWSLDVLERVDADIKIRDKELLLPNLALNDVRIDILLINGNLTVKPMKFVGGGGTADGHFVLRSQAKPPTLAMEMKIDQLHLGPMLDQLGYQRSVEGTLDANVSLAGQGNSMADLMAGLNGGIFISMSDGLAQSKYLALLQKFLGSNVVQLLNPFKKKADYAKVNCFVNNIVIKNGIADCKLLLDTDQTSIFGAGDVNLKTERLKLGIKPTPKKGYGHSGVGTISFSFKQLSQPFRLGGTLAKPSLALDPTRTAFIIGKFAGALALGPVGIAAFFSDVSLGKKDACSAAIQAIKAAEVTNRQQSEEKTKKGDAEGEKKKDKASKGFFRKLFRRR